MDRERASLRCRVLPTELLHQGRRCAAAAASAAAARRLAPAAAHLARGLLTPGVEDPNAVVNDALARRLVSAERLYDLAVHYEAQARRGRQK